MSEVLTLVQFKNLAHTRTAVTFILLMMAPVLRPRPPTGSRYHPRPSRRSVRASGLHPQRRTDILSAPQRGPLEVTPRTIQRSHAATLAARR